MPPVEALGEAAGQRCSQRYEHAVGPPADDPGSCKRACVLGEHCHLLVRETSKRRRKSTRCGHDSSCVHRSVSFVCCRARATTRRAERNKYVTATGGGDSNEALLQWEASDAPRQDQPHGLCACRWLSRHF